MPRLLITNNQLYRYGGSEMVTLELVEEFLLRGWHVSVFTNFLEEPFLSEFKRLEPASHLLVSDDDALFADPDYDLIWVNQSVLPEPLIAQLSKLPHLPRIVWHHMSSFLDLEAPILAEVELAAASEIFTISIEAKETLLSYGIPAERITLFPNPVPRPFLQAPLRALSDKPRMILAISNHIPPELEAALEIVAGEGVIVERVGTSSPKRVTPEVFAHTDAVITIAKSTQYALCLGIPCYEYDINGGCGWITQENFAEEYVTNFSGRTLKRKIPAERIAAELLSEYSAARSYAASNVDLHRHEFSLPRYVNSLLEEGSPPSLDQRLAPELAKRWGAYVRLQRSFYRSVTQANRECSTLRQDAIHLRTHISTLEKSLGDETEAIRRSRSYRLGNALLNPLRKFRRH